MCRKISPTLFLYLLAVLVATSFAGRKIVVPHDFPSIHAALGEADEGDTVFVSNGVYRENIAMADNVVLMGQEMLKTIIDGGRKGPCVLGADGATITNFTIRNGATGILCKNTRPTIAGNLIIDNKGAGIHALVTLPDISNNIIYRNEWTGIFLESSRATRTSIDHNVILENGYCAIFCAHRTEVLIRNNILMANSQYGVYIAPQAKKTRIIYNNIYMNRLPFNPTAVVNETNIQKEPMFISPGWSNFNYFIKPVSACKAKGENGSDIGLITQKMMVVAKVGDRDGDGIPDDIDQCPDVPEDFDGFEDEDGCPDYDNDKDGIYDAQDECPNDPEDRDGFQDADGCPDPDNDKDGICDPWVAEQGKQDQYAKICKGSDQCPNQPETFNGFKDEDGCPDEKPMEIKQKLTLHGVNFKTASAELLDESNYVLEQVYNSLEAYPNVNIEIAGHTDDVGNAKDNLVLSYQRAKSVMDYLIMRGISPNRMVAKGYGKEKPVTSNSTAEGRATNRRVEIIPTK